MELGPSQRFDPGAAVMQGYLETLAAPSQYHGARLLVTILFGREILYSSFTAGQVDTDR